MYKQGDKVKIIGESVAPIWRGREAEIVCQCQGPPDTAYTVQVGNTELLLFEDEIIAQ